MVSCGACELLAREALLQEGPIPDALAGATKVTPTYAIARDAFLLKLPSGLGFHYERGRGVTVSRPTSVPKSDVPLFLHGSVYGAIAWINGFVALHASAVVHDNGVHAVSGQSGLGKSTLAAALGRRGLPLFADDVLVLDLSAPDRITCLPGHKQIKLWSDALELAGAHAGGRVRQDLEKFYAVPPGGVHDAPLPLAHLSFLQNRTRDDVRLSPVKGAQRFTQMSAVFYRPHFCAAIVENEQIFTAMARISSAVPMTVFDRPFDRSRFDRGVDAMADAIKQRRYG